jgi:hypothetical protein
MRVIFQKAVAVLALGGMCLAQAAPTTTTTTTTKTTTKKKAAVHKSAATPPSNETRDSLNAIKEMLQQQQQQINDLKQQMAQRDAQLQQTQQQLQQAQSAAADAQAKAASAEDAAGKVQPAVAAVQADVDSVKGTLGETINTTIDEQKKSGEVRATLARFRWSGDMRVRYENFYRTALADRNRVRIRARFGFESSLSDDFVAGAFIATGNLSDATSTNESLTNAFEKKTIGLDRGYITYAPKAHKWLSATGGKFSPTWQKTNQIFDPDLNPEGFSEKLSFDLPKYSVLKNVSLIGMQLYVNEVGGGNDAYAFGGQASAKLQIGKRWTMTPSYMILNFRNENELINNTIGTGTATFGTPITAVAVTGPAVVTGFVSGSTYIAPNGLTNCVILPTAPATTPRPTFCSQYLISDVILNNQFKTAWAKLPFNLIGEYEQNLNANPNPIDGRMHDKMYFVEASLGQSKVKGDYQIGYSFGRTDQDALLASFAESDQRWPTNMVQHRVFANMRLRNNVTFGYTQWIGRTLNTRLPIAANGGGVALPPGFAGTGLTEPFLKRGQLDLVFTF